MRISDATNGFPKSSHPNPSVRHQIFSGRPLALQWRVLYQAARPGFHQERTYPGQSSAITGAGEPRPDSVVPTTETVECYEPGDSLSQTLDQTNRSSLLYSDEDQGRILANSEHNTRSRSRLACAATPTRLKNSEAGRVDRQVRGLITELSGRDAGENSTRVWQCSPVRY